MLHLSYLTQLVAVARLNMKMFKRAEKLWANIEHPRRFLSILDARFLLHVTVNLPGLPHVDDSWIWMGGRRRHRVAVATHPCLHSGPGTSQQFPTASVPSPPSSVCATYWPGSTSSLSPQTDGNRGHSTAKREGYHRKRMEERIRWT